MGKYERGHKYWNDSEEKEPSILNCYTDGRDCTIEVVELSNLHNEKVQVCLCNNYKNDTFYSVIIRRKSTVSSKWIEEDIGLDEYEFRALKALINGEKSSIDGNIVEVWRD